MSHHENAPGRDPNIQDFESAMTELESIVKILEDGQLTLEQSLEHFERGVALSRYCHTRLEEAERRVEVLTERGETRAALDNLASPAEPDPRDPE